VDQAGASSIHRDVPYIRCSGRAAGRAISRTLGWRFNADRMVMDYTLKCYIPAAGGTSSEVRTPA
jgi:hypothetical protein